MTIKELKQIRENYQVPKTRITVGLGTCGISAGAQQIYDYIAKKINSKKLDASLEVVGCIGVCKYEPIVEVYRDNKRYSYINVDEERIKNIIEKHVIDNIPLKEYFVDENTPNILEINFLKKQTRIALKKCGNVNPTNIEDYIFNDGFKALSKCLELKREEVVDTVKDSGLRGRGGAGFLTGLKWELTAKSQDDKKYVCCNADEGDPGAFMDRSVLEGDPFSIVEAMTIAAYAIGADEGYIYVRAEYPIAVKRLELAINECYQRGLLGSNILESKFSFNLKIRLGAGAFVCGEETALMTSIEGNRGEPRVKPPFPAEKGLFDKPTLLNNVETYANITEIINNGSDWFKKIGSEKSKGTKVFALGGKINNTGLVEIPIGTPLRMIIEDIGGGIFNNKKFKAAQTGGPSGGCIPNSLIDTPMDYENLVSIGSMMGSGGLIIMDEDTCMVDIAKFFLDFTVSESCGKCVPCRIGNKRLYELLEKITSGKGELSDLDQLEELSIHIKGNSLCGLGQSAPNPVLSTLKYFKEEYITHITDKKCPSKLCRSLITYKIDKTKCIGCDICAKNCPYKAITGDLKKPHTINQDICKKCGMCISVCPVKAIEKE